MITIIDKKSEDQFITSRMSGFLTRQPEISICLVEFIPASYRYNYFVDYGIAYPAHLTTAVQKRCAEYLAGRYAAKWLLKNAGLDGDVETGKEREPIWPQKVCGSISHTNSTAVVALSPGEAMLSPGIDIEQKEPRLMLEIAPTFTSPDEQRFLRSCDVDYEDGLLITFSAKESLYKCLFPVLNFWFGFECAEITGLDASSRTFRLTLLKSLSKHLKKGYSVTGRYAFSDNNVITVVIFDKSEMK